ncbi:MAG: hypothetical protein LBQ91_04105 [Oscillospiraceae bacterium]|jgi:hypothetical protein|nr:hypothetical protein [Oscillospiraceae bacterium]
MSQNDSWTDFRIEIQKIIAEHQLNIVTLNIHDWKPIEHRIMEYFTGAKNSELTWMWENNILSKFKCYAKEVSDSKQLFNVLLDIVNHNEAVWLFLEDSLHWKTKFWGYSGNIEAIVTLLKELPLRDFYIISKKLKWVIGQNHHDFFWIRRNCSEFRIKYSRIPY